jgi:hypothetical protein
LLRSTGSGNASVGRCEDCNAFREFRSYADTTTVVALPPELKALAGVVCVLAVSGCGHEGAGDGGAGSAKLERLIKVQTAQALLTDTGVPRPPADSPEVQEAADEIDVECESSGGSEYECEIGIGDRSQVCAMATNAAVTRIGWQRCGDDSPPEVTEGYVDCADIGAVATFADPSDDVMDNNLPPGEVTAGDRATADLKQVRVAVSSDAICLGWDLGAPVKPPFSVHFWAYPEDVHRERFSLFGGVEPGEPPAIGDGFGRRFDGSIGVRDSSVSIMLKRDSIPEPQGEALDGPFRVAGRVSRRVRGTRAQPYGYVDELNPPLAEEPVYP